MTAKLSEENKARALDEMAATDDLVTKFCGQTKLARMTWEMRMQAMAASAALNVRARGLD